MDEVDTFEDGPYTDGPMGDAEGDAALGEDLGSEEESEGQTGSDTEETSVSTDDPDDFDTDSQVNLLDEKEETTSTKKEEKTEEKPDKGDEKSEKSDEKSESSDVSKDDASKDDGDSTEEAPLIKAFSNGKAYEIPADAAFKTKVDGKWEKPTLQELKDNYSGVVAHDRKFTELGAQVKAHEEKASAYDAEIDVVREHMGNIANLVKSSMAGEVAPMKSMEYLLDLMGADTLQFSKALYENMAEDFNNYQDMTEVERENHWMKKENDYLVNKQESLTKTQADSEAQAEHNQQVQSLRETHEISEEDYVSATNDLEALGLEHKNPELVIRAAKLTPLIAQADELMGPYREQLTDEEADSTSVEIANTMLESPELTISQVKTILAEMFEVEDIVSEIENRHGTKEKNTSVPSKRTSDAPESFDDEWD